VKQAFFSIFSLYLLAPGGIGVGLTQVAVPESSDLTLSETGEYTIFYECKGVVNGTIYSTDQNISGLKVEIENNSTGFKLPLHPPQSTKPTIGSRSRISL
jgi:hypothetical protein